MSLSQDVAPGEKIYVWRTGDSLSVNPHVAVGSLPSDATAFERSVLVYGTVGKYTFEAGVEADS